MSDHEPLLSTREAARYLRVHPASLCRMVGRGAITPERHASLASKGTASGGHRFTRRALDAFRSTPRVRTQPRPRVSEGGERLYTTGEAGKLLGLSAAAMRSAIRRGVLVPDVRASGLGVRSGYAFTLATLEAYRRQRDERDGEMP
jgi:hypothetical protein